MLHKDLIHVNYTITPTYCMQTICTCFHIENVEFEYLFSTRWITWSCMAIWASFKFLLWHCLSGKNDHTICISCCATHNCYKSNHLVKPKCDTFSFDNWASILKPLEFIVLYLHPLFMAEQKLLSTFHWNVHFYLNLGSMPCFTLNGQQVD